MESPEPMFFDAGSGTIDADGLCYIEINPIYAETTSATVERRWYVTPTSARRVVGRKAALGRHRTRHAGRDL